jgi:hypothetical protein
MKAFFFFLLLFAVIKSFGQDFIKKNSGDTIQCKITEVTPYIIKFRVDSISGSLLIDSLAGYKQEGSAFISSKKIIKNRDNSQKDYLFSVCPGIGGNHGIGGIKLLFGPDASSGAFASVGYGIMGIFWKGGVQLAFNWLYFSGSYGTAAFYEQGIMVYETKIIHGLTVEAGVMLSLTKDKRFYIQIGGCYTFANKKIPLPTNYQPIKSESFTELVPSFGIGIRL